MTNKLSIVLAQLNMCVGDIEANLSKHIDAAKTAKEKHHADIIMFPELSLTGYPPEDLLLRKTFIEESSKALKILKNSVRDIYCIVGHPHQENNKLYNACSVIYNGNIIARYYKQCLPNYAVFDELRYFSPGKTSAIITVKGISVGIIICEDLWKDFPITNLKKLGAQTILVLNASPFDINKHEKRLALISRHAKKHSLPICYTNCVAGQDELIFDGGSLVVNQDGELSEFAGYFNEQLFPVTINPSEKLPVKSVVIPSKLSTIYNALVFSLQEYVRKNNFQEIALGLSGGIDSALTLAIAVDALGNDKVNAILMPSRYTADISVIDSQEMVKNLGVKSQVISIESAYASLMDVLSTAFKNTRPDTTEENLQARCRAIILMSLSNKFGWLILTTGNRSEIAVGYCTLYGDMAGGFGVLKDIPKTLVYDLARYRNEIHLDIPLRIIDRPPSAELAPDQKDQDTLPPYPELDKILEFYLVQELGKDQIVAQGFSVATVEKIISMVHKSEYKRYQSAVGPRIHSKSFGKDWRYPLTNKFKG